MAGPFSLLRLAAVGNCSSRAIIGTSVKYRGAWRRKRMDAALVLVNREWRVKVSSECKFLFEFFFFLFSLEIGNIVCEEKDTYKRDIKIGESFFGKELTLKKNFWGYFWVIFFRMSIVLETEKLVKRNSWRRINFGGKFVNRRISRGCVWILRRLMDNI